MSNRRSDADRQSVFDSLADPTRRAILEHLSRSPSLTISELASHFSMSRQGVTKHLLQLETAGLVVIESRGRERRITLQAGALDSASTWLDEIDRRWEARLERLKDHLTDSGSRPSG